MDPNQNQPINPQQPVQTPPPLPDSVNYLKLLVIALAILLGTLTIGGIGYFLGRSQPISPKQTSIVQSSPTPDPTANWRTYKYNLFSIKVPPEWKTGGDNSMEFAQLLNYDISKAPQREFDPNIDKGLLKVEIYTIKTNEKLDDYLAESAKGKTSLVYSPLNPTKIIVDGQDGIRDGSAVYLKDPNNSSLIIISFALDFDNYRNLADQILSTFKFTD